MSHRASRIPLNPAGLLFVLVVESDMTSRPSGREASRDGSPQMGDTEMQDRLAASPAQSADVIARAVGAVALATLAMIHVVDLPGTLGPLPLVGAGYLGIIAAAVVVGGMLIARSHRLVWAAAGGLAAAAIGGYVLTRTVGGFLGDHSDVGNWRCPLGLAAIRVGTLLILLPARPARRPPTTPPLPAPPAPARTPPNQ